MSAGFKSRGQQLFYIKELTNQRQSDRKLEEFSKNAAKLILMIDGQSLDLFLGNKRLEERFFQVATQAPSVCVCRCSPTQKALIVKKII